MAEHFAFSKVRAATRADWPVVPLGAVITRSEYGTSDPASAEGTIPIIGMKEVVDGNVLLDPSARIEGDAETLAPLMVRRGDILLNRTNSPDLVGKTGICRGDADAVFASYLVRLHVDAKKADAEYVNYWLNDAETQKLIKRVSTRAVSQANVNPTELKRHCPIPLPPLPEQRRIAGILRTWDEAIGAASRLIDAKRRRLDAITFRLVFGGARLANFGDADARQDARWFNLPAAWRVVKIGDVAKEISRTNADGAVSEVLSCSKHDGFVRSLEYFKKQVFSSDLSGYRVISRGEFGFPSNHVEEGSIGLQNIADIGVVSPIYCVFRFDAKKVDADYAFRVLKTSVFRHMFSVATSASVDRRGSLRWREFKKLPFPVPPLAEQQAIAAAIDLAAQDLAASKAHLEALKRQKRGLMQKLLTGEWRVPA